MKRYRFENYDQYEQTFRDHQDRVLQSLVYCEFDAEGLYRSVYYLYVRHYK